MVSQKLVRANVLLGYVAQIATMICMLLLSIVLVRWLSKSDYGSYNLINSLVVVLGIVLGFGLDSGLSRYIAELLSRSEFRAVNRLAVTVVALRFCVLVTAASALLVFSPWLGNYLGLGSGVAGVFLIIAGILVLNQLKPVIGVAPLQGYLETYKHSLNVVIYQLCRLLFISIAVYQGYGLQGVLWVWLLTELISLSIYAMQVAPKYLQNTRSQSNSQLDRGSWARFGRFSFHLYLSQALLVFTSIAVDNLVIGYYMPTEAVAEYALAAGIVLVIGNANPLLVLRGFVTNVLVRDFSRTNSNRLLEDNYTILVKLIIFLVAPLYCVLALFIVPIISLVYSPEYLSVVPVIFILIGFFLFKEINQAFSPLIVATESTRILLVGSVFSLYNLIADLILVPLFGVAGAAIATGSASALLFFYYLYSLKRWVGLRLSFPFRSAIRVVINLVPAVIVGAYLSDLVSGLPSLLLSMLLCMLLFLTCCYFFKVFTVDERIRLHQVSGSRLFVF